MNEPQIISDLNKRIQSAAIDCDCGPQGCGPSPSALARREFLKVAGLGIVAGSLGSCAQTRMAGPFEAGELDNGHLVPADKKLDPAWLRALTTRGEKERFSGEALDHIGMPCGGIGAGQLYLCGDGTLGSWMIFNNALSNFEAGSTYGQPIPRGLVEQGFALAVEEPTASVRKLDRHHFADVSFSGEYPIGRVDYADPELPVRVQLEAFSPFIPLEAQNSSLPLTCFDYTIENTSKRPCRVSLLGWLENACSFEMRQEFALIGETEFEEYHGGARVLRHRSRPADPRPADAQRPPILFEDFEGQGWGQWQVEGEAFGSGPAREPLGDQGPVANVHGEGHANSYHGGNESQGRLLSPEFTIERDYINFLLGSGGYREETVVRLLVDGKAVRQNYGWDPKTLHQRGWWVGDLEGRRARIEVLDKIPAPFGSISLDRIEFADQPWRDPAATVRSWIDWGELGLVCLDPGSAQAPADAGPLADYVTQGSTQLPLSSAQAAPVGLLRSRSIELQPGETQTLRFVLAWHFPNQRSNGHHYATRFPKGLDDLLPWFLPRRDQLAADTRAWRDLYYDSTLPHWLLDRLHSTLSVLATGTCQWWRDGRFWAFEGVTCCHGTCTHVWNYAHGHARLFPEIGRNVRERQDFKPIDQGGGLYPNTGLVAFRGDRDFGYAADGQCGTVLKALREHQMAPDSGFLEQNWPTIKKILEYSIRQDALGIQGGIHSQRVAAETQQVEDTLPEATEKPNGIMEGVQHNTYDINYYGPNTMVGSLYLAALRAGEEMALEMGDKPAARRYREIYKAGRDYTMRELFNGEYFVQDVDLEKNPIHQYKNGCLSDQVFGQTWAHQLGLGHLYPPQALRSALRSIWRYNWAPDVTPYYEAHPPGRWFISPGMAGLLTCTWPRSEYLPNGTVYRNEVWTGIEYQVANNMIDEGLVTEGLALCRAIHDRYDPTRGNNPYNEIECGDHYARSMASWGVYLSLAGFRYHGPAGRLGFGPRLSPESFRCAVTTAQAWARYDQRREGPRQRSRLEVQRGQLELREFSVETPDTLWKRAGSRARLLIDAKPQTARIRHEQGRVVAWLPERIALQPGQILELQLG